MATPEERAEDARLEAKIEEAERRHGPPPDDEEDDDG